MEVTILKRVFKFKEDKLADLGPEYSPEDIIEHYSSIYPELACGYIKNKKIETTQIIYTISTNIESKA